MARAAIIQRIEQAVLIVSFVCFSWLGMQAVHEAGHVFVAWLSRGEVTKVALHPLIVSRTDLGFNPHPLAVVWGGALLGSILPLLTFLLVALCHAPGVYLFRFFAGFCLIANGVYIGVGPFLADGADPWVMTTNGSPLWLLILFGAITAPAGLYLWHRQGKYFGFAGAEGKVNHWAALISLLLVVGLVAIELRFFGK